MTRDIDILLGEILEAIELLQRYTEGLSYEEFIDDVEKQDSVVRRLEIIGGGGEGHPERPAREVPCGPMA